VPYFLILIICGIPLLYMELAVGQFTRRGPIGALAQICPLFKGILINAITTRGQ
jgi:solute carrier family 6 GABA transporter-like protein 6/8/11/12/13